MSDFDAHDDAASDTEQREALATVRAIWSSGAPEAKAALRDQPPRWPELCAALDVLAGSVPATGQAREPIQRGRWTAERNALAGKLLDHLVDYEAALGRLPVDDVDGAMAVRLANVVLSAGWQPSRAVPATVQAPEAEGSGPEEVWIPPSSDCMNHAHEPCPHCGSTVFHQRTGRCGACGRRAVQAPDERDGGQS